MYVGGEIVLVPGGEDGPDLALVVIGGERLIHVTPLDWTGTDRPMVYLDANLVTPTGTMIPWEQPLTDDPDEVD